jgi:Helix-hairpin-helix domain
VSKGDPPKGRNGGVARAARGPRSRAVDARTLARNREVEARLREMAELLLSQGASPAMARPYLKAADAVGARDRDIGEIASGRNGVPRLPDIAPCAASAITELVRTGRWGFLERLRGNGNPERVFRMIPGVGPKLARLLHETLHVDTLEGLGAAAAEARLEAIPGLGKRRRGILRAALAEILSQLRLGPPECRVEPPVGLLLGVDAEYRKSAAAGTLPHIAPRRTGPNGQRSVPVLHTAHSEWRVTALYSSTARARELGRARDWVVIYFHSAAQGEAQRTVLTEGRGPLQGRRVVRGRETECAAHYAKRAAPT